MQVDPMSVYVVGLVSIKDREKYAAYEKDFRKVFEPFGGKILAVDDSVRVIEGKWPSMRTVLLSFPSEQAARQWYECDAYQKLVRLRADAADAAIAILSAR